MSTEDNWISVDERLPECNEKFGDSEYVVTKDENLYAFAIAWYNKNNRNWVMSHWQAPNTPIKVTHWKPINLE